MNIAGDFATTPYEGFALGRLFLFRGDQEITVGMQCAMAGPPVGGPPRRLLACLGRIGGTEYRPHVRTDFAPTHVLDIGNDVQFTPDVIMPIPDRSRRQGLVHIVGTEIHLGVIFDEGIAQLNVQTGELMRNLRYGKEDWGCGAWCIQRRSADGSMSELIRFSASLTAD